MVICQVNAKVSKLLEVNGLLEILKEELNNSEESYNNIFKSFKTLEKLISLIL